MTRKNNNSNMTEINFSALLQTFPSFDGKRESNIEFYLQELDNLSKIAKINDETKLIILKSKLTGIAREFLLNNPTIQSLSKYGEFTEILAKRFKKESSFEELQTEFQNLKQQPNESLNDFIQKFDLATAKYLHESGHADKPDAVSFINKTKLTRFLEAIRPDISLEVRKTAVKDYESAVKLAKRIEIAFKTINNESLNNINTAQNQDFCNSLLALTQQQSEKIEKLTEELNNLKVNKEKNQNEIQKEKFCAICRKNNHNIENCRFNGKNKNTIPKSRMPIQNYQIPALNYPNCQQNYIPPIFENNFGRQQPYQNFPHYSRPQNNDRYFYRNTNSHQQNYTENSSRQNNFRGNNRRGYFPNSSKFNKSNKQFKGNE